MITVDASVAIKWFVEEPGREAAMNVLRSGRALIAPDFILLEVMNVLRRFHRQHLVSVQQINDVADVLPRYFARFVATKEILKPSLSLSQALNHSIYDCAYLACAIISDAALGTADRVFAKKAVDFGYGRNIWSFADL